MLFFTTALTMFIAEMGDKTQFLLIAMASKFKIRHIIIGTAAAVLFLNAIAVCMGAAICSLIAEKYIRLIAGIAFLFFAYTSLSSNEKEKDCKQNSKKNKLPILSVFGTFFIAELGDKTQLTAITFAASTGMENTFIIFLACSLGLFAADMLGLAIGYILKSKLSCHLLNCISYAIFSLFGIFQLHNAMCMIVNQKVYAIIITCLVAVGFGLVSLSIFLRKELKGKKKERSKK